MRRSSSSLDVWLSGLPASCALHVDGSDVTYSELAAMADRAAVLIDNLDLADGEPVGLVARKSPGAIAMILGCLVTGRPFLLPAVELGVAAMTGLWRQLGCRYVLTSGRGSIRVDGPVHVDRRRVLDLAGTGFMLTTSGSTGVPKVVPLPRSSLVAFVDWAAGAFRIGPATVVFNYAPLNFDLCLFDVWTTLAKGGQVVLADQDRALDGRYLARTLDGAGTEIVQAVPLFFRVLADAVRGSGRCWPGVRDVICTGDSLPAATLAELPALFPNATLHNVYGCTETNDSFQHEIAPAGGTPVPIGSPVAGVHAVIVDDRGRVVTGVGTGELLVSTPFQAGRYIDPTLSARSWIPAPAGAPRGTYFRTGDIVHQDAGGVCQLTGRRDFQVKVRGVRTNPPEVEQVLRDLPGVADAVVLAVPDEVAGHILWAIIRRDPNTTLNGLRVRQHCAKRLPRTAVPAGVTIVDEEFPCTSTGKVRRTALRKFLPEGVRDLVASS